MKIHGVVQGTPEWLACRAGIPTASELGSLITDKGAIRTGETPKSYRARKLAEKWLGRPLHSFGGGVLEQGSVLEDEAIPWFEATHRRSVQRVGFITTDDDTFGCSPDGLIHLRGLEIKCPQPENHVKWLLAEEVPPEHVLQCQGGIYATGLDAWTFVSYCRGFPALVVDVEKDSELQDTICKAVADFNWLLESDWLRLIELNGGPPKRKPAPVRDVDPFATTPNGGFNL